MTSYPATGNVSTASFRLQAVCRGFGERNSAIRNSREKGDNGDGPWRPYPAETFLTDFQVSIQGCCWEPVAIAALGKDVTT